MNYADFALPRTPPDNRNGITPEYEVATALDMASPGRGAAEARLHRRPGRPRRAPSPPARAPWSAPAACPAASRSSRPRSPSTSPCGAPAAGFGGDDGHDARPRVRHRRHRRRRSPARPRPRAPRSPRRPGTPATPATPAPAAGRPAAPRRRRRPAAYPTSLMGVVAHLRQAMLDAENHHERLAYYEQQGGPRPANDPALDALHAARTRALPVWWEANTRDEIHRALDLAEEFGTDAVIVGGREAGKVVARLRSKDIPVVLRLDFPEEPKVPTEAEYRKKAGRGARRAAQGPGREGRELEGAGRRRQDPGRRQRPVRLRRRGGRQPGRHLPRPAPQGDRRRPLDGGRARRPDPPGRRDRRPGQAARHDREGQARPPRRHDRPARRRERQGPLRPGRRDQVRPGEGHRRRRQGQGPGRPAATSPREGPPAAKAEAAKDEAAEAKKDEPRRTRPRRTRPRRTSPRRTSRRRTRPKPAEVAKAHDAQARPTTTPKTEDDQAPTTPFVDIAAEFDADRQPTIKTGGTVLIKDATILTVTRGTIPRGSILIRDGKIAEVGAERRRPRGGDGPRRHRDGRHARDHRHPLAPGGPGRASTR